MNLKLITTLVLSLFLLIGTTTAQETQKRGELWEVQKMEVPPAKVGHFVQTVMEIAALAKASNVPSEQGWHFWSDGYDFYVANTLPNFAALDDPDAWMRAFGEEGSKKLGALFQQMEKDVPMTSVQREVLEVVDDWSYDSGSTEQPKAGTMYTFRVKPGHQAQFGEMIGSWLDFWKAIKFPYSISAYRPHMGVMNRVQFLFFHDGLANFMGKNDAEVLAEKAGKTEMHQQLLTKLGEHIDDMEVTQMVYHPEMSYDGPATTASNR